MTRAPMSDTTQFAVSLTLQVSCNGDQVLPNTTNTRQNTDNIGWNGQARIRLLLRTINGGWPGAGPVDLQGSGFRGNFKHQRSRNNRCYHPSRLGESRQNTDSIRPTDFT